MAYQRTQAQKLLTAPELALFDAGRTTEIKSLSKAQLRSKLERSRKLRDKYRDLHRRQRVALRGKSGSKSGTQDTANLRTQQKEEILAESVVRFETRLAQIEREEDRDFAKLESAAAKSARSSAAKTTSGSKSGTAAKKTGRTAAAKRSAGGKAAAKSAATRTTKTATTKSAKKSAAFAKRTSNKTTAKKAVKQSGAKTTPSTLLASKKAAAKKASGKKTPAKSAKAPAANPLDVATQKGKVSGQAKAVGKGAAGQSSRALSIGAHQRGQTQRSQAKRDS